jgi:hypothetical protein
VTLLPMGFLVSVFNSMFLIVGCDESTPHDRFKIQ